MLQLPNVFKHGGQKKPCMEIVLNRLLEIESKGQEAFLFSFFYACKAFRKKSTMLLLTNI